jgi:hypothetical protein
MSRSQLGGLMRGCPPLGAPEEGYGHPWHPYVHAVEVSVVIEACDGTSYIPTSPFYRLARSRRDAWRQLARCVAWCERQNRRRALADGRGSQILSDLFGGVA